MSRDAVLGHDGGESTMRLCLTLMGDLQARIGSGTPVRLRTRKTQALLAYLAMPAGVPHSRDKLATLLWGDQPLARARGRFRETLFALRRALAAADPRCLTLTRETVAIDPSAVDVDAATFDRLARADDVDSLVCAVDLYRGEFLEGLDFRGTVFEHWLMGERERLRELALEALARLLARQRRTGATGQALRTALRLVALEPLQESVHRTVMRLYADLGRRGSALQHYQVCVGILHSELGVEPEQETRQLYQDILSRQQPKRSLDASVGAIELENPDRAAHIIDADGPLVGRGPEMARLTPLVAETGVRGRVILLVGEAGIGKTRLVGELTVKARTAGRSVLSGRCHESERILPFAPWLSILRAAWVQAGDARLAGLPLPMRRELGRLLPELCLVDGDGPPATDYLVLFEGVSRLLERAARAVPTLAVLEDLHWADEMSTRLLAFVGRRLADWQLVVVATAREDDLADSPIVLRTVAELEREPHVDAVALRPLSQESTAALVRGLARAGTDGDAVERLSQAIWRASEGNPLVVVEATRAVAHEALWSDLGKLTLPERVREIIRRQLGRLTAPSRDLVALASVVGREFEFELLHRVSGLAEEAVARGVEELIRRRVLHSVGERLDFQHDRVREVAYAEMLAPRRNAIHRRVAEALEIVHASDLVLPHLALGRHCFEGEVWDKAVLHLRRAGATALGRFAKQEAVACFERALAALEHLPHDQSALEEGFEIRLELRPALNQLGENARVVQCLREAGALADRLNDDRRRGRVFAFMSVARSQTGELDDAVAESARAREIAERIGDLRLRLLATDILEQSHYHRGDYERVVELALDNLAVLPAGWAGESFGRFAPTSVYDRVFLVRSLAELGRFDEAGRHAQEGIALAEPTQHAYAIGMALWAAGLLGLVQGDWARARPRFDEGIAALRAADAVLALPWAVAGSALVLGQLGESNEALSRLGEGEQLVQALAARQVFGGAIRAYHALGHGHLVLGRPDEARRLCRRAFAMSPIWPGDLALALHLRAEVAADPDAFDGAAAEADYQGSLRLAEPRGMRPLVAHCRFGLGRLHRRMGKRTADEHLVAAAATYRELAMPFWLARVQVDR